MANKDKPNFGQRMQEGINKAKENITGAGETSVAEADKNVGGKKDQGNRDAGQMPNEINRDLGRDVDADRDLDTNEKEDSKLENSDLEK